VVAVAGGERRREADVDLRLGHADDPRDPPQRLGLAPEVLGERRARVVEEVDAVEVEDLDGAGPEVRDAVLVLAPQAERRADLGADGVAAAFAAGHHDDPAADAVAVVPDAAGADDARVVVGMGPLAHHVDLDRLGRRVGDRLRGRSEQDGGHCRHDDEHASHVASPSSDHLRTRSNTFEGATLCSRVQFVKPLDNSEQE
jgi:hypothetical protein